MFKCHNKIYKKSFDCVPTMSFNKFEFLIFIWILMLWFCYIISSLNLNSVILSNNFHSKELEARREQTRQWRDQQIAELSSLQSRTPQQDEQLRALKLEREFQRRAQEAQNEEEIEQDKVRAVVLCILFLFRYLCRKSYF